MFLSIVNPGLRLCLILAVGALILFGIYNTISRTFIEPAEERRLAKQEAMEDAVRERSRREEQQKEKQEKEKEQQRALENAAPEYVESIHNIVMFANVQAMGLAEVKTLNALQHSLARNNYREVLSAARSSRADFAETVSACRKAKHDIEARPLPQAINRLAFKSLKLWRTSEAQVQEIHAKRAEAWLKFAESGNIRMLPLVLEIIDTSDKADAEIESLRRKVDKTVGITSRH